MTAPSLPPRPGDRVRFVRRNPAGDVCGTPGTGEVWDLAPDRSVWVLPAGADHTGILHIPEADVTVTEQHTVRAPDTGLFEIPGGGG